MTKQSDSKKLYRCIWRWHFYAGLFCIPFILTLAISGSIYLFKPQIDNWVDREYKNLKVIGERSSAEQQIHAAMQHLKGAQFVSYQIPEKPNDAVVIAVKQQGKKILVYVHPFTLDVLKVIGNDDQFIRQVRSFHGELMLGNTGSVLVELAGCWAIVMIVSGLYLWWPRSATGLAGVLYPRLKTGKRQFLRDLHAVIGFWVSVFTLFLLISGLPWALVWGTAFKEVRSWAQGPVEQNWTVNENKKMENDEHAEHRHQAHSDSANTGKDRLLPSQQIVDAATALNFAHPVEIFSARANAAQWQVSSQHQNRTLRADAWFDKNSGSLEKRETFSQRSGIDKAIGVGIAAHEGHLFGWLNQLLGLLTSLGLVIVSISGFILWRKRKPDGQLGAPASIPDARVGMVVATITLLLALFLPLLLVSLITLFLLERLCFRHLPGVRHWLGLAA